MSHTANLTRPGIAFLLLAALAAPGRAQEAAPTKIEVFPPDVSLLTNRGKQLFVVQASYGDGITRDVTEKAKASLADAKFAKLEKNVLTPLSDGETKLLVE